MSKYPKGARRDPHGHSGVPFKMLEHKRMLVDGPLPHSGGVSTSPVTLQLYGSCEVHATYGAIFARLATKGTPLVDEGGQLWFPSTKVGYGLGRTIVRAIEYPYGAVPPLADTGVAPSAMHKAISTWGLVKSQAAFQLWGDDDPVTVDQEVNFADVLKAAHKIFLGTYQIPDPVPYLPIARALASEIPCVSTFNVGSRFEGWKKGDAPLDEGDYLADLAETQGDSLHALQITNYELGTDGVITFRIQNSWGSDWGDNGWIYAKQGWVKYAMDTYAIDGELVTR